MIRRCVWVGGLLAALWVLVGCTAAAVPAPSAPAATTEAAPAATTETAVATVVAPASPSTATGCLVITQGGIQWLKQCDGQDGPPYTTAMRDAACQDIIPFKADEAFQNNPSKPLGWTFGVNFDAVANGQPLGCLRLYYGDQNRGEHGEYVAIDGGGILVDTCRIEGDDTGLISADGTAHFCANYADKGVVCAMDLEGWIRSSDTMTYLAAANNPMPPAIANAIASFKPVGHVETYTNMALVGVVNWPTGCDLHLSSMPLITYVPDQSAPAQLQPQPNLWLEDVDSMISFPDPCNKPPAPQWKPNPTPQAMTYELDQNSPDKLPVHYAYQSSLADFAQTCPDTQAGDTIALWEGPAELWIGWVPKPGLPHSFLGTVDGVLIDPYDSKPPTKVDPTN